MRLVRFIREVFADTFALDRAMARRHHHVAE